MNYLSVCSGIEAASVAWEPLGWKPVMFSEIEPFPIAVLKHHYPDVPVHGDFRELIADPPMCDLLCGGTPCQAFSVAGLRESLSDDRGNLTLQFVLLANAIDHLRSTAGLDPGWILWENVPGVLSTSDNAFGAFLGGLVGSDQPIDQPKDGWPCSGVVDGPTRCAAWRTLDAQHFGLAQRRKRVFVLARGGAGRWAAADALLPIIESSSWHSAPSRKKGKGVAPTISARTSGGGGLGTDFDLDGGLIAHTLKGEGFDASEDGTGRGVPLVPMLAGCITASYGAQTGQDMGADGMLIPSAPILVRMREGKEGGGKGPLVSEDQSLTLATANDQILAFDTQQITSKANRTRVEAGMPSSTLSTHSTMHASVGMQVRRLTPRETERLQGFPDDYTLVPRGNKMAADGPRYKAIGNSWATNCARYIGERIQAVTTKSEAA